MIHRALAEINIPLLTQRRIVLIRGKPGTTSLFQANPASAVIAHVGLGPYGHEDPSIYLGMFLFDVLHPQKGRDAGKHYEALLDILRLEEQAIEWGISHLEMPETDAQLRIADLYGAASRYSNISVSVEERHIAAEGVRAFQAGKRTGSL